MGTLAQLRQKFSEPAQANAAKEAWLRAESAFHAFAMIGAHADVYVTDRNGLTDHGEDFYKFGHNSRMIEIREGYEAVSDNKRACIKRSGAKTWECSSKWDVSYLLGKIDWSALIDASVQPEICGTDKCLRIKLLVAGKKLPPPRIPLYALDPATMNDKYNLLVRLPSSAPIELITTNTYSRSYWARSDYVYDFNTPIETINMPQ